MDIITQSIIILSIMLFMIFLKTRIFIVLYITSFLGFMFFTSLSLEKILSIMLTTSIGILNSWVMIAIPLFILMGEIISRTSLSKNLFEGLEPLVKNIPGKLLHTNILSCTVFSALNGSSIATTSTIGKISIEELFKRDYNKNLVYGTLAGSGTFGMLIPPSIIMIVYGVLTKTSIIDLFIAGILPGIILCILFMVYVIINSKLFPKKIPNYSEIGGIKLLKNIIPMLLLIFTIFSLIYSGMATPTEVSSLSLLFVFIYTSIMGEINLSLLKESMVSCLKTSIMIFSIIGASGAFSTMLSYLYIPQEIINVIVSFEINTMLFLVIIGILYVILGFFLDGISLMIITIPVLLPLITELGMSKIWFGIFVIMLVELSLITPPFGINLYVIQGISGEKFSTIIKSTFPFMLILLFTILILIVFPEIVLWTGYVL